MPNLFAYSTILIWPLIAIILAKRCSSSPQLAILLILVPYLALPLGTAFDIPILPFIGKVEIASLMAILILRRRRKLLYWPEGLWLRFALLGLFLSPVFTFLANTDSLVYGPAFLKGMTLGYVVQSFHIAFFYYFIPFVIGFNFLNSESSQRLFLKYLVGAALIYSIFAVWEVRMAPQLHAQIYGFFPHSFAQQIRFGGYRPVIFLGHGLYVAVFFALAFVASLVLRKSNVEMFKNLGYYIVIYLGIVLVLCKTMSALIYAIIAIFLVGFVGKTRRTVQLGALLTAIVMFYPILRGTGLIPVDSLVDSITKYSEERAASLKFRFMNEEILLEKVSERPIFGWGGGARSGVFNEEGRRIDTQDGVWIIAIGVGGWFGFLSRFGMLCFPVFSIYKWAAKRKYEIPPVTAGLGLILSFNLLDLLPNSSLNALTFLMAGSLAGFKQQVDKKESSR